MPFAVEYQHLYKIIARIFMLALIVSEMAKFQNFSLENVCQDHRVQYRDFLIKIVATWEHVYAYMGTLSQICTHIHTEMHTHTDTHTHSLKGSRTLDKGDMYNACVMHRRFA